MTSGNQEPATRKTWQDQQTQINFGMAQPETPFLPPHTAMEDEDVAIVAMAARDRFTPARRLKAGLEMLRRSPNWNTLTDDTAEELLVPLDQDPYAQHYIAGRTAWVEARDKRAQARYPKVVAKLRHGIQEGIRLGYTLPEVVDRFEGAVKLTATQIVDPVMFDRQYELGNYNYLTDRISVSPLNTRKDLGVVLAHELVGHKVSGGTFRKFSVEGSELLQRTRIGLSSKERHVLLDEAVRHHMTLSYLNGGFATIDPDLRPDRDTKYYQNRKLLAEFVRKAAGVIDPRNMTRASDEETDELHADITYRRKMFEESIAAYGVGAYHKLDQLFTWSGYIPDELGTPEFEQKMQTLIDRIHEPTLNPGGDVMKDGKGFLDVDMKPDWLIAQEKAQEAARAQS